METKKRCGSNFNEEPISFEEFFQTYNNFLYNFSGPIIPKGSGEEKYRKEHILTYDKEYIRNYYFLKKINKELANKIQRKYRLTSKTAAGPIAKLRYEELLKLGYSAYLLLREHTDNPDIQEAIQQRNDRNGSDDYKAFFA